jgi:hypothetical protein
MKARYVQVTKVLQHLRISVTPQAPSPNSFTSTDSAEHYWGVGSSQRGQLDDPVALHLNLDHGRGA